MNAISNDKIGKDKLNQLKEKIRKRNKHLKSKTKDPKAKINRKLDQKKQKHQVVITKIKGTNNFFFNPFNASNWENQENFQQDTLPINNFDVQAFDELQNHNSEDSALNQLLQLATDLKTIDPSQFTEEMPRACFILCNTYTKPQYRLGVWTD